MAVVKKEKNEGKRFALILLTTVTILTAAHVTLVTIVSLVSNSTLTFNNVFYL